MDAILSKEYGLVQSKPGLPDVLEMLSKTVITWLRETPKREQIKELFRDTLMPLNVPGLSPVKINEIVYQRLSFKGKVNDQRLRGINTYFTRGICLILSVLDSIISMEAYLSNKGEIACEDRKLKMGDLTIDCTDIRRTLSSGLQILCCGSAITLQKYKTALKPYLDPKYHNLLRPTNQVTELLLGSDLEQRISDSSRLFEASKKLAATYDHDRVKQGRLWARQSRGGGSTPRGGRQGGHRPYPQNNPHRGQRYYNGPDRGNTHPRHDMHAPRGRRPGKVMGNTQFHQKKRV